MIVYIGNKLSKHGYTPTTVETLGEALAQAFDIVTVSDKRNRLSRLADMLWSIWHYRQRSSVVLIDTYSTSNFYYALLCGGLARFLGIPYIPILHGGNLPHRVEKNRRMADFLFLHAAVNVTPSGYLQEALAQYGYAMVHIPNSIAIDQYLFKKRIDFKPKLLYVRAFSKLYNPTMAIRVLQRLLQTYPDAQLCMVGPDKDGSLGETKALAAELGVAEHVVFTGKLTKEAWWKLSEAYDIFINTTNVDNTPVSVIEAMALGLPVVTTDVGGIRYLVENGVDALTVSADDSEAMSAAVKALLDDQALAGILARNARKKAESYLWQHIKHKWINAIESCSDKIEGRKK